MRNFRRLPAILLFAAASFAQAPPKKPTARFEVASVKPCNDDSGRGFRGNRGIRSPGTLDLNCQSLRVFIMRAYVYYKDGRFDLYRPLPELGGVLDRIEERYSIHAKAGGAAGQGRMNGPMLRALLEDRFQLRIHRETRQVPVYQLKVANGGSKIPRFQAGSCTPLDPVTPLEDMDFSGRKLCVDRTTQNAGSVIVQLDGMSMEGFIKFVLQGLGRPVIDRTGLTGLFNFHLEYWPDPEEAEGAATAPAGPSIFTAIQRQLGLKLVSAKGPGEALVIDHLERPSEN